MTVTRDLWTTGAVDCLYPLPPSPLPTVADAAMGACFSQSDQQSKIRSEDIDRSLDEDNRRLKRECKILLLGKSIPAKLLVEFSLILPHLQAQESPERALLLNR